MSLLVLYIFRCGRHGFGRPRYLSGRDTARLSIRFALRKVSVGFVVIVANNYKMVCQHVHPLFGSINCRTQLICGG